MHKQRVLTGITTTGAPHLGNYAGAIRRAVDLSRDASIESFYFLADYHALAKCDDPERVARATLEVAAGWLALGLDVEHALFYRQSDIPEIAELTWLLHCVAAKGLMNRAHAYKAAVSENTGAGEDPDRAITMALFCYPVLMAADILLFKAHRVPVGSDQKQHVEMTRDIAQRFNHHYGERFVLPEAELPEGGETLPGLDGRKMSKSYDNTIPLFAERKNLRKLVMKIKTNSQPPEEPKNPEGCTLFQLYNAFAGREQGEELRNLYARGIAWGEVKERLFALLDAELEEPRRKYQALLADSAQLEETLQQGARRARELSGPFMRELRHAVGLRPLH